MDYISNTLNTTRVCGGDHFANAIEISNVVYADKSPDSVIITNGEMIQDAILSTPLIHFPYNAPILYSHANGIDINTIRQIFKLKPKGINGIQVFVVSSVSLSVSHYLSQLGLRVEVISGESFYETSANVTKYLKNLNNIMITSSEDYLSGLFVCAWAAHMGTPILFTEKYQLPSYTREVIQRAGNANIYLIGSTDVISPDVEAELNTLNINYLGRISGNNPYDTAVNFAKYKSPVGDFGWGKTDRNGHAFTFTSIETPFNSASGAIFAHLGKHSPTLIVSRNELPPVTRQYLESVKPLPKEEPMPPFMHGWIVGCENAISSHTQKEIEKALSIDEAHIPS